jgi:hypothetical protein
MARLFIFCLTFITLSCTYQDLPSTNILEGKWVEVNSKTDTIIFTTFGDYSYLSLNRGKELRNGILLPKYLSGGYDYKISSDKISLRWWASSNSAFNEYHFNVTQTGIIIGDFYNPNSRGASLSFKKIR